MKPFPICLLAGIFVCQAVVYYGFSRREVVPAFRPWSEFPRQVGKWVQKQELTEDEASLEVLQPDDYIDRTYAAPGDREINLFIAYFKTQRTGHGPHSPQACLPGSGWEPVSSSVLPIAVPSAGITINANQYVVRRAGLQMAVYYWYQTARRTVANQYMYQIYAIPELLTHGRTDVALVRVIAPMNGDDLTQAKSAATEFIQDAFRDVRLHIPAA